MKILMFSTHSMKYIWYSPQKSKYPLCHKNCMTTRYITLGYWRVTHDAVRDNVIFSIEIMSTFKAIKAHLGSAVAQW